MRKSPWFLPDASRPRLLRCTAEPQTGQPAEPDLHGKKTPKTIQFHARPDLQPISRFSIDEVKEHWLALIDFVLEGDDSIEDTLRLLGITEAEPELRKLVGEWMTLSSKQKETTETQTAPISDEEIADLYRKTTHPTGDLLPDPAELEELSLPFIFIPADRLNNETFDLLWGRGEPIVVDGLGDRLKHSWTPATMAERFGKERCCMPIQE